METAQVALWAVVMLVAPAIAIDFMNGFHDAANSIATVVSTGVLRPTQAVVFAACFNLLAVAIFHLSVAATVGKGIVQPGVVDAHVVAGALTGAVAWNLITWYYGIPSSSSHALIGGIVGAATAKAGAGVLLAGGILNPYPACHTEDFHQMVEGRGVLISEVAPTARPAKWRFLTRNRLIAAWSAATIVVEAGARSGALATARWAMSCGRELGAVPGAIDAPMAVGCLELARNGATIIRDGRDAAELAGPIEADSTLPLFGMPVEEDQGIDALAPLARRVFEALPRSASATVASICVSAGLGRQEVNRALMDLSVAGLVTSSTRGWARKHRG